MTNVLIAVPEAVPEIVKVIGVVLVGFAIFSSIYKLIKDERHGQAYKKRQKQLAIKGEKRRANYGKEYKDLDEIFSSSSYKDDNLFIKTLLDNKERMEDFYGNGTHIWSNYISLDGGEIMTKIELFKQMEHIHSVYLKDWKKKKKTDFRGFEEIKKHRQIIQITIPILEKTLQNKIKQI